MSMERTVTKAICILVCTAKKKKDLVVTWNT